MKNSKKETQMSDITITGYCAKCHQWFTLDFLATLRLSAHEGGDVCLNCLADKSWGYLKRHVCSADYPKVARYKQFAEIPQLQADNHSLVEQMNKMAMRMEHKSGTAQRSCKS